MSRVAECRHLWDGGYCQKCGVKKGDVMQTFVIEERLFTKNPCAKPQGYIQPQGIMVHSVGSKGTNVERWMKWDAPNVEKCVHAFLDENTIRQVLPWNYLAWHAGNRANTTHIAFEICEPLKDTEENRDAIYSRVLFLCTYLCQKYNLKASDVITHCEGHDMGIASNHADVNHWWGKGVWKDYTMDRLRKDIADALGEPVEPIPEPETEPEYELYEVKKGDTLSKIARAYDTTYKVLAEINGIESPYIIRPGQILKVPANKWKVSRLLKYGVSGADVEELQKRLNKRGYPECGAADGIFGKNTEKAVRNFQKDEYLYVDGIAGKNTISALGGEWQGG